MMRVGIYVHGHPALHPGGSEVAAYSLYQGVKSKVGDAFFIAAVNGQSGSLNSRVDQFSLDGREFVIQNLISEDFYLNGISNCAPLDQLAALVRRAGIDILHFHHFLGIGVDGIFYLKGKLPLTRFVFTAHEYLTLCARDGQLLTSHLLNSQRCDGPLPTKCAMCMPHRSRAQHAARLEYFRQMLRCFDAVVVPSRFLANKIAAISPVEVIVVPNSIPVADRFDLRPMPATSELNSFAFFGQINTYKGVSVLVDAAQLAGQRDKRPLSVTIYGGISTGDPAFAKRIEAAMASTKGVMHKGRYEPSTVLELMREIDWVVVPSIWWENSPVVIEEALCAGRPIICSDIGGMAEKVEHGISGLHFRVGSAADLARVMRHCVGNQELWSQIAATRRRPDTTEAVVERHLEIYRSVLGKSRMKPSADGYNASSLLGLPLQR